VQWDKSDAALAAVKVLVLGILEKDFGRRMMWTQGVRERKYEIEREREREREKVCVREKDGLCGYKG